LAVTLTVTLRPVRGRTRNFEFWQPLAKTTRLSQTRTGAPFC